MPRLKNIFLHCSSSPWGDVLTFDIWHKRRGWSGVGYHYVILNGRPFADVDYWEFLDGQIEPGRHLDDDPIFEEDEVGAHVAGRNRSSIGICLVGKKTFTDAQLQTAKKLLLKLLDHFDLKIEDILGHYEDPHTEKTCPNIPMPGFRLYMQDKITLDHLQKLIEKHIEEIY
jgi:hypothetical protein